MVLRGECVEIGARFGELGTQLLLNVAEAISRVVTAHLCLELGARLIEALHLARLDLVEPDDVVSKLRLDGTCDLAHLHPEEGIRKGLNEAVAIGPAEIATIIGRAWIL